MRSTGFLKKYYVSIFSFILASAFLYFLSLYSYLLFHSIIEIITILIAFGIFIIVWNARELFDNNYFIFVGIAFLFVGIFDLLHTLAYEGMNIFSGYVQSNISTQLWLSARYLEAFSFLIAVFFIKRRLIQELQLGIYVFLTSLVLLLIFYFRIFPTSYIQESGLTPFKIISEFLIMALLLASAILLYRYRNNFDRSIFYLLLFSIITTILSELFFTLYNDVYGLYNMVVHILKLLAFLLLYEAVIETGLNRPISLIFFNLKKKQSEIETREKQFNSFFNSIRDSALIFEVSYDKGNKIRDTKLLEINCNFLNKFQVKKPQIINKSIQQVFRICNIPVSKYTVMNMIKKRESVNFDIKAGTEGKIYYFSFFDINRKRIAFLLEDVTKQRIYSEEIEKLSKFPLQNPNPVMRVDKDLNLIFSNDAAKDFLRKLSQGKGKGLDDFLSDIKNNKKLDSFEINFEKEIYRFEVAHIKEFDYYNLYGQNITRRIKEEKNTARREQRLALSRQKERLARELHDTVTQTLFTSNLTLDGLEKIKDKKNVRYKKLLDRVRRLNKSALTEMRLLLYELRPAKIAENDLEDLLSDYVSTIRQKYDIGVEFNIKGKMDISFKIKKEFYRIAQEAFNNIIKHSDAKNVEVNLVKGPALISMRISDDGIGFKEEDCSGSYGLKIMQERADSIGAELEIISDIKKGTVINLVYRKKDKR